MYVIFFVLALLFSDTALAAVDSVNMTNASFEPRTGSSSSGAEVFSVSESMKFCQKSIEEGKLVKYSNARAAGGIQDWNGIKRDTAYFLGYQFAVIGALYVMPENMSGWSKEQKEKYSSSRWWKNVSHPVFDQDKWYLNYAIHPYWGAAYYVRARERNFDRLNSFLYSAFLSGIFEFGIEALFERVSIQDLIVTPVAGTVVGRYFENVRYDIKSRDRKIWYDDMVLFLTDPLGEANKVVDRWFGIDTRMEIKPAFPPYRDHTGRLETRDQYEQLRIKEPKTDVSGVELTVNW